MHIIDTIEKYWGDSCLKPLIKDLFTIDIHEKLICLGECGSVRTKITTSYSLHIEIEKEQSIYWGFNKYVEEERISDFYCDQCKKKGDILKQTTLNPNGNYLIINLNVI